MYKYNSPIGQMLIFHNGSNFSLSINETIYGFYDTAGLAAGDVYSQSTGCDEWDSSDTDAPEDLSDWELI